MTWFSHLDLPKAAGLEAQNTSNLAPPLLQEDPGPKFSANVLVLEGIFFHGLFVVLPLPFTGVFMDGNLDSVRHQLPTGIHQLATGINQLPTGIYQLPTGINQLPTGINQLPTGIYQLATGINQLPTGIHQLPTGIYQLPTGMMVSHNPPNSFMNQSFLN